MPDSDREEFYNSENFALIGMSRRKNNFGWSIYRAFAGAGRKIYPLHPEGGERNGVSFFKKFEDLPEKPDACIVCTDLKKHGDLIPQLANSGIKKIWFQQGSYDKTILEKTRQNHFDPLTGCVLMYFPGISFGHRLHRFFHELFSKGKN